MIVPRRHGRSPSRLTIPLPLDVRFPAVDEGVDGEDRVMESNQRFYMRRAAEERTAALRSMTPQARDWHQKLAQDFARRATEGAPMAMTA